jgi:hypothetical protein
MLFSKMFIMISGSKKPKTVKNTRLLNVLKNRILGLKLEKSDRFLTIKKLNIILLFIFFKIPQKHDSCFLNYELYLKSVIFA